MKKIFNIIKNELVRQAIYGFLPLDLNEVSFEEIEDPIQKQLDDIALATTIISINFFDQFKLQAQDEGTGFVGGLQHVKDCAMAFTKKFQNVEDWNNIKKITEDYNLYGNFSCWDDIILDFASKYLFELYQKNLEKHKN